MNSTMIEETANPPAATASELPKAKKGRPFATSRAGCARQGRGEEEG